MLDRFIDNINNNNLFVKSNSLLIAVSGGVDSVVLCNLCKLCGYNFGIAHCNFQLRRDDSVRDENFVKEMATKLGVPFYAIRFDTKTFAKENKVSTQEAARILRYDWFEKIRQENHYDYILTAHHADDNIETLLINFFRGTGLKGLTGIKEKRDKLVRPLLFAKRKELETFLQEKQFAFVQDESNLTNDYTRNYFRNTILPLIKEVYPGVQDNLLHNIDRFKEAEILYQKEIVRSRKKLFIEKGNEIKIPVLLLEKTPAAKTIFIELLKPYHFSAAQIPEIVELMGSESGRYILSSTHRILKDRKHLIVAPLSKMEASSIIIEKEGSYTFQNGKINLMKQEHPFEILQTSDIALLDADKIKFPLILRPWRIGDYFYPLGMRKKKKLSRFFIDNKFSLLEKEQVRVLEMDKKIIWIVGYRIDDRFKITDATLSVLKIEFKKVQ